MGYILIGTFVILFVLGVPIAFVLAISGFAAILYEGYPLVVMSQRFFTGLDSFPFMAIPLFMLAGSIMSKGGVTQKNIDFALSIFGNIRGALSHVFSMSGIMMGGF